MRYESFDGVQTRYSIRPQQNQSHRSTNYRLAESLLEGLWVLGSDTYVVIVIVH